MRTLRPSGRPSPFKKIWNKQFLIFLFFLALSTVFWAFQALSETYEEDFQVPIELKNVPSNVVVTTDLPRTLHVTLRDKGSVLLTYSYTRRLRPIVVDFSAYANAAGHVVVPAIDIARQIAPQLMPSTQTVSVKPENLEFYFNYGQCKRVPVVLQGTVKAGRHYTISSSRISADSVMVYASKQQLDTITAAYLQPLNYPNLQDTLSLDLPFIPVRGAKFVPDRVSLCYCVDRLVEKTVSVPVQQVNFPASKQLRTFPGSVSVSFQVGMALYRKITSENFVIVVNYEELLQNKGNKCHLSLKTLPPGVSYVRIMPQDVEYVIEDIPDYDPELHGE